MVVVCRSSGYMGLIYQGVFIEYKADWNLLYSVKKTEEISAL